MVKSLTPRFPKNRTCDVVAVKFRSSKVKLQSRSFMHVIAQIYKIYRIAFRKLIASSVLAWSCLFHLQPNVFQPSGTTWFPKCLKRPNERVQVVRKQKPMPGRRHGSRQGILSNGSSFRKWQLGSLVLGWLFCCHGSSLANLMYRNMWVLNLPFSYLQETCSNFACLSVVQGFATKFYLLVGWRTIWTRSTQTRQCH